MQINFVGSGEDTGAHEHLHVMGRQAQEHCLHVAMSSTQHSSGDLASSQTALVFMEVDILGEDTVTLVFEQHCESENLTAQLRSFKKHKVQLSMQLT